MGVRAVWQGEEKTLGGELQPRSRPRRAPQPLRTRGSAGEAVFAASPSAADPAVSLLRAGPGKSWVGWPQQEGFLACFAQTGALISTLFSSTSVLRSLESSCPSISTVVAETVQRLRTPTVVSLQTLRYRLSSAWERGTHSLRAGWLRFCSCVQG